MIRNARLQLLATLLNTMAVSSFTVGIAAPVAAVFYGQGTLQVRAIAIGVMFWAVPILTFAGIAQLILGGIRQP